MTHPAPASAVSAAMAPALALFHCDRRNMTLTAAGCARLFLSTETDKPQPWEGRAACLHCPIGAAHAGRAVVPLAGIHEALRRYCPRCRRPSARMIRGEYCPSCYNRSREVRIGRNRKGHPPLLRLFGVALAVIEGDASPRLVHVPGVASIAEAALLLAKRACGPLFLGWAGAHAA